MPIETIHRLSELEAERIKAALLKAAEQGCQDVNGGADPERLARGLIAAFRLVDEVTAGPSATGSAASGRGAEGTRRP